MNIDIQERQVEISLAVRELQIRLQRNKEEEQELIQELFKRKGQLEFLEGLEVNESDQ